MKESTSIKKSRKLPSKAKKDPKKSKSKMKVVPNKHELYEASVQDAADDASILDELYRKIRRKKAFSFREDFCGTFKVACEWVKLGPKNKAIGLDLDSDPLSFGKVNHLSKLSPQQQARVKPLKQNVISVTKPASDIVAACNFSYWIFKTRKELISYFKCVHKSLKQDGLFFLDMVGGTEMIEEHTDKEKFGKKKKKFTYIWKQENYNPITNEGFFSISYKLADGTKMNRAFTYDWRVWTIQEVRECLEEAGFKQSWVYWEIDDKNGEGTGEFERTTHQENCPVWLAYIVASKI